LIRGLVQGVGFRPYVCRLARNQGLLGEVDNRTFGVSVIIQGDLKTADLFSNKILQNAPPASFIRSIEINPAQLNGYSTFEITDSKTDDNQITEISPDIAVCNDCLEDMDKDPERIDYPFVNCTNCGPRFTIIEGLPYDRVKTTMNSFIMCGKCKSDYNDILNRRFHAQPIACNSCGPEYKYISHFKDHDKLIEIIQTVSIEIESGKTVAIKGIGGYHLMCDALNNDAVSELRLNKQRDFKPFAVLFRDLETVRKYCHLDNAEETELQSWRRPILILKQKEILAGSISSGLSTIGAMLPYMPLHYLLFRNLTTPAVVLTSGNISDEPIITDDHIAEKQLMKVAVSLLSHNRKICNRTDDSVIRFINRNRCFIRRSRGFVPRPVELEQKVDGILALGGEQKNSICLGKGNQGIMTQYIGDLKNPETFNFFIETIDRFSGLLNFKPELICCDLHPDYLSTHHAEILAKEVNIPVVRIQHHHAHIASCMAEHGINDSVIGISLDGTGYGTDGRIWGGEFMVASLDSFERFSHFDYVPMPGGDKAVSEPWRMALAYLFHYNGENFDYESVPLFNYIDEEKLALIKRMMVKKINCPLTSGAGRLFDAVAAILGLCKVATFDSEPPMRLESVIDESTEESYPFMAEKSIVFAETIVEIIKDLHRQKISVISAKFHNTVANVILEVSKRIRNETSLSRVVLSGGVFQNKYLLEKSVALLSRDKFEVFSNNLVPANDGGISLGQLVIASKIRR
jgi:hydrogenase maturation protein HypF